MSTSRSAWIVALASLLSSSAVAQSVVVTVKLDAAQISVGGTTTLHVLAQVAPAKRATADRIFSWNVDLLNSNGAMADASAAITKPLADKDPQTSSNGTLDGANRRSVYDTFLNLPGAGVAAPVELFSVPIKGLAAGTVTFNVQAGSGATGLSEDFIVAPQGGGDPEVGADYSQAQATLNVGTGACQSHLSASVGNKQVVLNFTLCTGQNHTVEYTDDLAHPTWQALSGAPQNTGTATDNATSAHRYYRIRQTTQ